MIGILAALASVTLAGAVAPSSQEPDDVRALGRDGPDSLLVAQARERPDDLRKSLRHLFADAATASSDSTRAASLAAAERLAHAYAVAWRDSFLMRQVARLRSLSLADRRRKIEADSLRLAGNEAWGSSGIDAAMGTWRESLRISEALTDTAAVAATLGNLGAGFYVTQRYDSAESYLTRARDLAERIGDHRTAGNAVGTLASVRKDRGDLRRAGELYALASGLRERTGDTRGLAADQNNLGLVAQELGDLVRARRAFEAALLANREAGRADPAATNLVNLGNLASLEGSYGETDRRYREALSIYREGGNRLDEAFVQNNLGILAMRRADYAGAIRALSEAAAIYDEIGSIADQLTVRSDLARARAATGDLQGARAELERAEALASASDASPSLLAGLALARADLALQFNQLPEAERLYVRAERLSRGAGAQEMRAAAQYGIGVTLLMRESYERAESALELAQRAQAGAGDRHSAALTRLLIGHAKRERGDTASARQMFVETLSTLRALGDAAGEAAALGALGELETQAGLPLTAEPLFARGLSRLGARPAPGMAWPLHAGLAEALRSRGALDEAQRELGKAIEYIERVSAGLSIEERRAAFLTDKWDVYVDLAFVEEARGRSAAAFEASERLRARQMLDLLVRGRIPSPSEASDELTAREQDLRRRIAELSRQLEIGTGGEVGLRGPPLVGEAAAAALEALASAQQAYSDLLLEIRENRPEYAELVRGEVPRTREVMSALARDQALLEYLVGDSTTLVFVITADTVAVFDLNVSRDALTALVDFARGTLASPRDGPARQAWRAPMRRLFHYLVAPAEASGLLIGKTRLLIAPHAELHYLPFAALLRPGDPEEPLVERYVVEYVPSAAVWLRLRTRPEPAPRQGVLALAPHAQSLPGSRAEITAIGRIHGNRARLLMGAEATEGAFRANAPRHEIVHLATYGILNKHNPLFSFVELTADGAEDGRLEVHEVFGLELNARLLVLSACQTGLAAGALADVPPGDDWVGLVRAFLFSGASNVLATLWPVEDLSTARLMERFYQELAAGRTPGEALTRTQRAAVADAATAHPFSWAGFVLVGGR